MTTIQFQRSLRTAVGVVAITGIALAQDTSTSNGGWRRVGDPQTQTAQNQPDPNSNYPDSSYPQQQQQNYPQQQQQYPIQRPPQQQQQGGNYAAVPTQIGVPAGTYVTVRVNQLLSSDRNQPGDAFSATLIRPLVANGVVVAEPGQTVGGRVAQAQKAGHIEGLAKLGIELTDLTLVDGQQLPVRTTLVSRTGNSSVGRDAGTIAATTGVGAAIGAGADWGRGAAIGAGAGAVAGIIGVLVTRGQPSVIYPEQVLTFRLEQPLTVSTDRSPQAFRYVQANEYSQPAYNQNSYNYSGPAPVYAAPPPAYYGGGYPYYGYPYYGYPFYGGGFSLFVGPGWGRGYYGGGRYYGGGFGFRGGYRGGFRR